MRLTKYLICILLLLSPMLIAQDNTQDRTQERPPRSELVCVVQEEPGFAQSLTCTTTLHGKMSFTLLDENGQSRLLDSAKWTADMGVLMLPSNAIVIIEFVDIYGRTTVRVHYITDVVGNRV